MPTLQQITQMLERDVFPVDCQVIRYTPRGWSYVALPLLALVMVVLAVVGFSALPTVVILIIVAGYLYAFFWMGSLLFTGHGRVILIFPDQFVYANTATKSVKYTVRFDELRDMTQRGESHNTAIQGFQLQETTLTFLYRDGSQHKEKFDVTYSQLSADPFQALAKAYVAYYAA